MNPFYIKRAEYVEVAIPTGNTKQTIYFPDLPNLRTAKVFGIEVFSSTTAPITQSGATNQAIAQVRNSMTSLYFDGGLAITIGTKSAGFLKKAEPVVEVKYTNPYIKTKSMQNIIIQEDLKWYDRKRNWFGIGIGMGAFLTTFILIK